MLRKFPISLHLIVGSTAGARTVRQPALGRYDSRHSDGTTAGTRTVRQPALGRYDSRHSDYTTAGIRSIRTPASEQKTGARIERAPA
jgi:hypothetical protein